MKKRTIHDVYRDQRRKEFEAKGKPTINDWYKEKHIAKYGKQETIKEKAARIHERYLKLKKRKALYRKLEIEIQESEWAVQLEKKCDQYHLQKSIHKLKEDYAHTKYTFVQDTTDPRKIDSIFNGKRIHFLSFKGYPFSKKREYEPDVLNADELIDEWINCPQKYIKDHLTAYDKDEYILTIDLDKQVRYYNEYALPIYPNDLNFHHNFQYSNVSSRIDFSLLDIELSSLDEKSKQFEAFDEWLLSLPAEDVKYLISEKISQEIIDMYSIPKTLPLFVPDEEGILHLDDGSFSEPDPIDDDVDEQTEQTPAYCEFVKKRDALQAEYNLIEQIIIDYRANKIWKVIDGVKTPFDTLTNLKSNFTSIFREGINDLKYPFRKVDWIFSEQYPEEHEQLHAAAQEELKKRWQKEQEEREKKFKEEQLKRFHTPDAEKLKPSKTPYPTDLSTPLFFYSDEAVMTIGDSFEHIHDFGGVGSGKTSTFGTTAARSMHKSGYCGLQLTNKNEELDHLLAHAKITGRENDIIIFSKYSGLQFNPLEYQYRYTTGEDHTTSALLETILEMYRMGLAFKKKSSSGSSDPHWDDIRDNALRNCINLIKLSGEILSLINIKEIIDTMPMGQKDVDFFKDHMKGEAQELQTGQERYCLKLLIKAEQKDRSASEDITWKIVQKYFLEKYPLKSTDSEKMSIQSSIEAMTAPFVEADSILRRFFSGGVSDILKPESTFELGKIIILHFPLSDYGLEGLYAQMLYKMVWQQAILRRKISLNSRPAFLWIDESQNFISDKDERFLQLSRSYRAGCVLITQSINNYVSAQGGGAKGKSITRTILGLMSTQIFHWNKCKETNEYAANLIAKTMQDSESTSYRMDDKMGGSSTNRESFNYQVTPHDFTTLTKPSKDVVVSEAVVSLNRPLPNKKTYLFTFFTRNFMNDEDK